MIVDAEKLVSNYLREHVRITPLGARVVGKTPDSTIAPWIRVTQINAPQGGVPDHHVAFTLQLDCYAGKTGGQPEANSLAIAARAALQDAHLSTHALGIVSGCAISSDMRLPDTDFEPARDRRVITATVWAHPKPS